MGATTALSRYHSGSVDAQFKAFQVKYNTHYANAAEERMRLDIFRQNLEKYAEYNSKPGRSSGHGVSKFSDLRKDEWLPSRLNEFMSANAKTRFLNLTSQTFATRNRASLSVL